MRVISAKSVVVAVCVFTFKWGHDITVELCFVKFALALISCYRVQLVSLEVAFISSIHLALNTSNTNISPPPKRNKPTLLIWSIIQVFALQTTCFRSEQHAAGRSDNAYGQESI